MWVNNLPSRIVAWSGCEPRTSRSECHWVSQQPPVVTVTVKCYKRSRTLCCHCTEMTTRMLWYDNCRISRKSSKFRKSNNIRAMTLFDGHIALRRKIQDTYFFRPKSAWYMYVLPLWHRTQVWRTDGRKTQQPYGTGRITVHCGALYLRVGVKGMPLPASSDEYLSAVDELASLFGLKSRSNVARAGVVRCCCDISINDIAL